MTAESFSGATSEVIIVGGGVIGLTIARALRLRNVRNVTLLERGQPGAEASWAAGGILGPQTEANRADEFFQLSCASRDLYPDFANALQNETGIDIELETSGTLYLGFDSHDEEELRHRREWQTAKGFRVDWLTAVETRALERYLNAEVRCALRFPNDFQVENRKLVGALLAANEKLGVKVITECEVQAIEIRDGRVRGVETSRGFVAASTVVLAAGAWTSLIEPAEITQIQVEPVRGQMLCFQLQPGELRHVLYSRRGYLVPRRDGRVLAGSTTEHAGFDRSVTHEAMKQIQSMAFRIAPALKEAPLIDAWAGFRPRAADDLPVLGRCAGVDGLVYATGHYRNGILLAPITAELIADTTMNSEALPMLAAFSPDRFSIKVQGRPKTGNPDEE